MTNRCFATLAGLFASLAIASSLSAAVEIVDGKTSLAASAGGRPVLLYRKSSPAATPDTLVFKAWVEATPFGGSDKATWGATLAVYGQIEPA